MICIYEPLFSTGKDAVTESGFCVVNGIVALATKGLYVGALIKKSRYCMKIIIGDLINSNFADREVEYVDMLDSDT